MNRFSKAILLLLTIIALVGCGGGGTSTPNPYAGSYSGVWWAPGYPNEGESTITIDSEGRLTGTTSDTYTETYGGTLRGRVSTNGHFDVQVQYPGEPATSASGSFSYSQTGTLIGNGIQQFGNGITLSVRFEYERN